MANPAPKIDQRTARVIARQVQDLLEIYTPAWQEFDPITGEPKGVSAALIGVFSRFAEIIIERLNKVPEKNALAFLDLLGASLLPPQPARVPLTFSLSAGSVVDGVVPAGTQVAAPPGEGEKEPVIFETERELVVTAAQLQSIFVRDPDQDKFSDFSASTTSAAVPGFLLFQGNRRIEHILYLGHCQLLGFPQIERLRLIFTLDKALGDNGMLEWEIWDGARWNGETFQGVSNLTQPGENIVDFGSIAPIPISPVNSVSNRWLRCCLITPITRSTEALSNMVRESQLPEVSAVRMEVELRREIAQGLLPEMAFTNAVPVDLGKEFFPFGEQPKFNDIFYMSSSEAFSKDRAQGLANSGASIELAVQVANSHLLPSANSVWPSDDLQLAWECWNGINWQNLGTSYSPAWLSLLELDSLPAFISDPLGQEPTVLVQGTAQKDVAVTIESKNPGAGACATPGTASGVYVADTYAYVADGESGLQVIDISDPVNPRRVDAYDTIGTAIGVYVAGPYAYVADGDGKSGLQVIDISNPANPRWVGACATPGPASGVYVAGTYAYVADGWSGLQVIDISDPANPRSDGSFATGGSASGVYVADIYAYVADEFSGLLVIVIDPMYDPTILGYHLAGVCDTPGTASGVYVTDIYAYVADGWSGLQVIDISVSDPKNPPNLSIVGECATPGFSRGVYVAGTYAYVADGGGLQVIDISNPKNPRRVGSCDTPGTASGVYVTGTYAYVADGGGLQVIDISDPANPGIAEEIVFRKTVTVGTDRRFAVKVPLIAGLNIISCTAQSHSRTTTAWAVIFQGTSDEQTVQLTVNGVPEEPVPPEQDEIKLEVIVSGPQARNINSIRVTNGNALGSNSVEVPVVEWDENQNPKPIALSIPLSRGRNELLIEGLDAAATTRAATTVMISRKAPKTHDPDTSFGDYTYAFCQSGTVHLRLPDTTSQILVNGQEAYWLRVRLVRGDYGKDASFTLNDPADPSQGFLLVPASFRPPIVSEIKIGYQQSLSSLPEYALAYNNQVFDDVTTANKAVDSSFEPFCPAPEEKSTLYFGFTLPSGREAFPNRTVSMFTRMVDFKFGERYRPVSPLYSRAKGTGGSVVTHPFFITNDGASPMTFELSTYGTGWDTEVAPSTLDLPAGESGDVQVQVDVPTDAPVSSQDKGYLRLVAKEDPVYEPSATFTTFVEPEPASDQRLELSWAYWNGKEWSDLRVRDDSENFIRSGLIEFLAPADFKSHTEFGLSRYWLRVCWEAGQYPFAPRLSRVLTNTTMAAQTITLLNESLGSSDGSESQRFHTTRAPVLAWQQLEVRELEQPSIEEQAIIEKEEGKDAISIKLGPTGRPQEIWVRWHEVPDFYGSSARDRHYVLDHLTGKIWFGDGLHGRIPPAGTGNIRMRRYQTGGGKSGNKPAKSIVQLKTTIPYVDQVINTEPATGGADAEETGSLLERASHSLRHRERAVTVKDFEDLAKLASTDVARTLCLPLYNLAVDPDASERLPGTVSLIIVPRSTDPKPLPSQGLIEYVRNYVNNHRISTAKLAIVGPEYLRVDIEAEIALVSLEGASEVRRRVLEALSSYLHPLLGGLAGKGWDFGRMPHKSDLYALIEPLPGVDHIRTLKVTEIEDRLGVRETGRFLVYSGTHTINLIFPED